MSDAGKVAERLAFMELDAASLARVASLKPHIDRHIGPALSRFYEKLRTVPAVSKFFSGPEQVAHAKSKQASHWSGIAAGQLDNVYFDRANVIGNVHARIGLEPRWYIGGYGLILETLVEGVMKDVIQERLGKSGFAGRVSRGEANAAVHEGMHALSAVLKAVMLDIDIAVSTYFERTMDETRELNRQIGAVVQRADGGDFGGRVEVKSTNPEIMQLAAQLNGLMGAIDNGIAATKEAIHSFAKADLTGRMSGNYRGAFADLQRDIDEMGGQLTAVVDTIRGCSQSLTTANTEILSGSNDLAERTTRQAAAIEQTTAAMEQLSQTVAQNSERAREASATSEAVSTAAAGAGEVIAAANGAMDRISTSSGKISNIIGLIDDIAFQTNLLALNASVEAARAGDAGKGFAVVAVEVRRLAQSAAGASAEVKTLIEQSSTEVTSGTRLVGEAVSRIEKMQDTIRTSRDLVLAIAVETTAQAGTINEVASAIRTLDEMTQHNAALVEETNAAIEQTERQTEELSKAVRVFSTGGGQIDTSTRSRRPAAKPAPGATAKRYLSNGNAARDEWAEF